MTISFLDKKKLGVVEKSGNMKSFYFGLNNIVNSRVLFLENLLNEAKIEAFHSTDILSIIWKKFIFISPTATTLFDKSIGEVLSNNKNLITNIELIEEVKQITKSKDILLSDDVTEKT